MSIYADLIEFKRGILTGAAAQDLAELEIPVAVVNKPGRGYSLVFRAT